MTSRNVILKFVQSLDKKVEMMTVCLLGKKYQNPLINALYGSDNLFVYHQKGERVFQKNYHQQEMVGSILEVALAHRGPLQLKKDDFIYEIVDPFYKKPMSELTFALVFIMPVLQEENIIGFILIYSQEEIANNDMLTKDYKAFVEELISEEEKEALLAFNNGLLNELNLMYTIKHDDHVIYSSKAVETLTKEELKQYYQEMKNVNGLEVILYQIDNSIAPSSIHVIDDITKTNTMSLLGVKNKNKSRPFEDFFETLKKDIEDSFPADACFYKYDNNRVLVGFSEIIDKRLVNQFSNNCPDYLINFIRVTKELPPKQNLVKVASYLMEHLDEAFDYQNYLSFRKKQEEDSYYEELMLVSNAQLTFHPLENSKSGDILGYLPSFVFQNLEIFGHHINNEELSYAYNYRLLTSLLKSKTLPGMIILTFSGKQLLNEEIIDLVMKINQKSDQRLALQITKVGNIDQEILLKKIKTLRKKDILMVAGDDVFANFNMFELMDYFLGIVIDHPLLNRVKSGDYDLATIVINYYLTQNKLVIFHNLSDEDKKMITPHQNIYWEK